jgi:serine phosphatase RsbU (regulator of sigma subunit)
MRSAEERRCGALRPERSTEDGTRIGWTKGALVEASSGSLAESLLTPPAARGAASASQSASQSGEESASVRALLLEDDDGDAFLVQEYLLDAQAPVVLERARSLREAGSRVGAAECVLLDLGLPDADGLSALQTILELAPSAAVIVLTGLADESRGAEAVAMGAQDYLVKGQVDGQLLARAIRYAVERKRADESLRRLYETELRAAENARLERGLLPRPVTRDPALRCVPHYLPGTQSLLGGDFYDVVETADGTLHLLIGDVAGHGPDEAALGVCLRVAWRTLVLTGRDLAAGLPTSDQVRLHARSSDEVFATVCMLAVAPDRRSARLFVAGHPVPMLFDLAEEPAGDGAGRIAELPNDVAGPALGIVPGVRWGSRQVTLPESWTLMLYTDGLVEGRVGAGPERLGTEGLRRMCQELRVGTAPTKDTAEQLVEQVRGLNGGDLTDDIAMVLITCQGGT